MSSCQESTVDVDEYPASVPMQIVEGYLTLGTYCEHATLFHGVFHSTVENEAFVLENDKLFISEMLYG